MDPITLSLGIGALVGGGAAMLGNKGSSSTPATPAATQPLPADPSTPAIAAGSKPAQKKGQQQSFLSGASALQSAGAASSGGGTGTGKSLLGQ